MRRKTEDRRLRIERNKGRKGNPFSQGLSPGTFFSLLSLVFSLWSVVGCAQAPGNVGNLQSYPVSPIEAQWICDGEPLEFEGERWYPADGTESFLDSEVYSLGEYRGVQFFADKEDVRPYGRLYTKFGKNRFRYFERSEAP